MTWSARESGHPQRLRPSPQQVLAPAITDTKPRVGVIYQKPACPSLGGSLGQLLSTEPEQGPARALESRSPGWARLLQGLCCLGRHLAPPPARRRGPRIITVNAQLPRHHTVKCSLGILGQQGTIQPWRSSAVHQEDRQKSIQICGYGRRGPCRDMNKKLWVLSKERE